MNDGKVQTSFTLPIKDDERGEEAARQIAKKMGLPVNKFICASNRNNVLTDFFKKGGEYNRNRDFFTTTSPSMDILISSNLERLLFFASDFNDKLVAELMNKLNTEGSYKVAEDVFAKIELSSTQAAAMTATRLIPSTSCGRTRTTCAIRTPQLPFVYTRTTAHAPATKRRP